MGSTLIVYYSFTGNSRRVAQLLATQTGWPVGEVVEERPRAGGGLGYLRCALDSLLGRSPAIRYEGPEPASFATVVLVAPVWVGLLAAPMRSFVENCQDRLARIAVLTTMNARGSSNAVKEISSIAGRDPVLEAVVTSREIDDGSCADAIKAFAEAVVRSEPAQGGPAPVWTAVA